MVLRDRKIIRNKANGMLMSYSSKIKEIETKEGSKMQFTIYSDMNTL